MAKSFVSKLNKIQTERAAKAGLPKNGVSDAIKDMAARGEYPAGKTYVESDTTDADGLRTLVYHNRQTNKWVFQQDINGKVQNRFEAPTREEIFRNIDAYAREIEDAHDPVIMTCNQWLRDSKWGREFDTFQCPNAWLMLEECLNENGLDVSLANLDKAFTTILDRDDVAMNWHRFIQKRERLAREAQSQKVAPTPHENLPAPDVTRKDEDNKNRAKDLKTLRHEALFSGRVKTTPSTGTVIRK